MAPSTGSGGGAEPNWPVAQAPANGDPESRTARYFGGPYRYVTRLPVEPRHYQRGHLDNAAAAELLSTARNLYFGEAISWPGVGVDTIWTPVRRVVIEYETEAFEDEVLYGGVRTVQRTNRTLRLRQAVWTAATEREVLRCEAVIVTFDVRLRLSIAVPDAFWALIEKFDGPMGRWPSQQ